MRTLVAPVNVLEPIEERTIEFKGLNRKPVVEDGEMSAMKNLSSDNYPLLTPRKPRGKYALPEGVTIPLQVMTRYGKIALLAKDEENNIGFYFDGNKVDAVTGLSENTSMICINTKTCFFPEKKYLEMVSSGSSVTIGEFGNLEETYSASLPVTVTINNDNAAVTLEADHRFAYDDAITIDGTLAYTASGVSNTKALYLSTVIEGVSGHDITLGRESFIEMTGEGATDITFTGTIERTMPDLEHVIEWNNRLWGANSRDNTIYACKLGDPKNWHYFQGTSLDSFYAQQGTDGVWTGAAPYSNHVIFFKQNSMTRIYGSSPATFQISNAQCYGVEDGSRKSVTVVNDQVFYKSIIGIMAYDGGTPYCISEKLNKKFKSVVGGTEGHKYYASIQSENDGYELMVLDIEKAEWHKEDAVRFHDTCTLDNKLYFVTHDTESLTCSNSHLASHWLLCGSGSATSGEVSIVNPENTSEDYQDYEWMATFGPFDEFIENRKIYSKLLIRLARADDSEVRVYISINEGEWELVQEFNPTKTGGDFIPIIPRRCDRYSVKIEGRGNCSIKSLTRRIRRGTGGRL